MVAAGVCFRRYSDEYNLQQLWSLEGECMCDVVRDIVCMLPPYVLEYYLLFLSEAAIVSCFAGGRQCDSYYYRWRFGCGCLCGRTRGPRGRERLFGPEIFTAGTGVSFGLELLRTWTQV